MSNQASEDEIVAILTNEYSYLNQRLDGGQNEEDAVAHYTDKLLAIIRTEKLKLLDRLEKQATIVTSLSGEKAGTIDLTAIEAERTKLEAEL